jgi:hypothetical protein
MVGGDDDHLHSLCAEPDESALGFGQELPSKSLPPMTRMNR